MTKSQRVSESVDQRSNIPGTRAVGCELCNWTGYIVTDQGARPCKCQAQSQLERRLHQARIPQRFQNKTLESFKAKTKVQRDVVAAARNYIRTFDPDNPQVNGLKFVGAVGSGKTHVAVAILRELIGRGFSGLYYNVVDLLDELRESYQPEAPTSGFALLDQLVKVDLLVLDDLGAEATTGWVRDRLYQIINRRYEESRPTIVTTNMEQEDLERQVGERIASRLCEMCTTLNFPQTDYRRAHLK